jgi:hypothetical protein
MNRWRLKLNDRERWTSAVTETKVFRGPTAEPKIKINITAQFFIPSVLKNIL